MEVQKIEGISPDMLWTFLAVLVGLMGLVVLGYKVIEIMRKERERRENRSQLSGDITEKIANKVMEKLTPRIDARYDQINIKINEIEQKLNQDREAINIHTRQLDANEDRVKKLEDGNHALCHGIFALLSHELNGNSVDKLKKTQDAMRNYLIDGVYKEENWK